MQEPFLIERIEKAKSRAYDIIYGLEHTEEAMILQFRFMLSQRLHIGIYDEYFENLTLDQLAFEMYLWKELDDLQNPEKTMEKKKKVYTDEVKKQLDNGVNLFNDDWEEIDDTAFLEKAKKDFAERKNNGNTDAN